MQTASPTVLRLALALLSIAALAGCSAAPVSSPSIAASESAAPTAASAAPASAAPSSSAIATPAAAAPCVNAPGSQVVANAGYRFDFRLPPAWQLLKYGDPAWTTVYGTDAKGLEGLLDQNTIVHFAIPQKTPDAREVSMSVFVRKGDAGASAASLAIDYWSFVTGAAEGADWPDATVRQDNVVMNSRIWLRLTTSLTGAAPAPGPAAALKVLGDHVVVYILERDSRGFFFVFRGTAEALTRRADELRCVVGSLRFKP